MTESDFEESLKRRISDLERRQGKLFDRLGVVEVNEGRAAEQRANLIQGQNEIKGSLTWLSRLVIAGLISGSLGLLFLAVQAGFGL